MLSSVSMTHKPRVELDRDGVRFVSNNEAGIFCFGEGGQDLGPRGTQQLESFLGELTTGLWCEIDSEREGMARAGSRKRARSRQIGTFCSRKGDLGGRGVIS